MQSYCGNPTEPVGENLSLVRILLLFLVAFHGLQSIP